MMRIILIAILIFCLLFVNQLWAADKKSLPGPNEYPAPELTESSSLEDYLLFALAANPGLKASYLSWEAAAQIAPQAGALPNPQLRYGYVLRRMDSSMPAEIQSFGISQEFPWFGKLSLARRGALAEARGEARQLEADRIELCRRISLAWYDYWLLGRRIEITRSGLTLLEQAEAIVRARYVTSQAGYNQLLMVQVELGKLEDLLASLENLAISSEASFNALLGRDAALPLPFPVNIDTAGSTATPEELTRTLRERNPELARLRDLRESAGANVRMAEKQRWPDLMVGLDYTQTEPSLMAGGSGRDPVMASISLELPLSFGRYDAAEKQAASNLGSLRQQETDLENNLRARLAMVEVDIIDARRRLELYSSSLAPRAEQALEAALGSLAAGGADVLDVLDAQRTLLDFQLERESSLAALGKARAELESVTGGNFNLDRAASAQSGGGR